LEVKFGEGGDDSKLFVEDLFAAYAKYASSLNLKCEVLDSSDGKISAKISGKNASKAFENEAGKHIVQRVPPTETHDRRQTSVVVVAILPVKSKKDNNFKLNYNDLTITTMRGTGPGGQHRNRTESCVRVVHNPTGIQAIVDKRDQSTSKREALEIVTEKVAEHYQSITDSEYNSKRKDQLGNSGRGDKVRTYNFINSKVTDHRTNKSSNQIKKIMKGQFDLLK
jgi:peptide chain release factor 1